MAYKNVQFIAYNITTGEVGKPYVGLADDSDDIAARSALFIRALTAAAGMTDVKATDDSILKVFVAPEFLFRGKKGAYPLAIISELIDELQKQTADPKWKDWVIVFGTALGASTPASANGWEMRWINNTLTKVPVKDEVNNFSLIQLGGQGPNNPAIANNARMVMKEHLSGIDFTSNSTDNGYTTTNVNYMKPAPSGPGLENQQVNYDGGGVFELAGITFGVEICLDHSNTVSRLSQSALLPGQNQVQMQIVPSGGMTFQSSSVVAQNGGYVFNVDGLGQAPTVYKVDSTQHSGFSAIVATKTQAVADDPVSIPSGAKNKDVPIDELYVAGPGSLVVFPAQVIADPIVVPGNIYCSTYTHGSYSLSFSCYYDGKNALQSVFFDVNSADLPFTDYRYSLPMDITLNDTEGKTLKVKANILPASGEYKEAVKVEYKLLNTQNKAIEDKIEGSVLLLPPVLAFPIDPKKTTPEDTWSNKDD